MLKQGVYALQSWKSTPRNTQVHGIFIISNPRCSEFHRKEENKAEADGGEAQAEQGWL